MEMNLLTNSSGRGIKKLTCSNVKDPGINFGLERRRNLEYTGHLPFMEQTKAGGPRRD